MLCLLDTQKSMGPDGVHARVLRELAGRLTKPLSIYYHSWLSDETPNNRRCLNIMPIYKEVRRRIQGTVVEV